MKQVKESGQMPRRAKALGFFLRGSLLGTPGSWVSLNSITASEPCYTAAARGILLKWKPEHVTSLLRSHQWTYSIGEEEGNRAPLHVALRSAIWYMLAFSIQIPNKCTCSLTQAFNFPKIILQYIHTRTKWYMYGVVQCSIIRCSKRLERA